MSFASTYIVQGMLWLKTGSTYKYVYVRIQEKCSEIKEVVLVHKRDKPK